MFDVLTINVPLPIDSIKQESALKEYLNSQRFKKMIEGFDVKSFYVAEKHTKNTIYHCIVQKK